MSLPLPGLSFPGGLLASGSGLFFAGSRRARNQVFLGDYWLLGARCNLPVPAAPGIEFSWGFTGPWERGIFYSARFRAKRSFAGGLLMILADSVIFATFRPKPCLAGGFLRIRGFSVILRGSPGAERCARDFSGPRIFFFGGRVLLAGPRSPEKVAECAPGSARKGGKHVAPVHSGAKTGLFSGNFTPHDQNQCFCESRRRGFARASIWRAYSSVCAIPGIPRFCDFRETFV